MSKLDDFGWFTPDDEDNTREEEFRADAGRLRQGRWDADGGRLDQDGRWEFRDDVTPDGIKGGQGRSAESVRGDALAILAMVGLALSACLLLWLFT